MLAIYANKCSKAPFFEEYNTKETLDYIREQLDKFCDWYITPKDAVKYGFVDKVITKQTYRKYLNECHKNSE
jgi:ATP-dependent protease ClpP protease subunit